MQHPVWLWMTLFYRMLWKLAWGWGVLNILNQSQKTLHSTKKWKSMVQVYSPADPWITDVDRTKSWDEMFKVLCLVVAVVVVVGARSAASQLGSWGCGPICRFWHGMIRIFYLKEAAGRDGVHPSRPVAGLIVLIIRGLVQIMVCLPGDCLLTNLWQQL